MNILLIHNHRKTIKTLLVLTWVAMIATSLWFAFKPQPLKLGISQDEDKLMHLLAFMTLSLLPILIFSKPLYTIWSMVFVFFIGVVIEVIQAFLPTRGAQLSDIVFDALGIAIGGLIGLSIRQIYQSCLAKIDHSGKS